MSQAAAVVGLGLTAFGAVNKFQATNQQSRLDQRIAERQFQIEEFNAGEIRRNAELNQIIAEMNAAFLEARAGQILGLADVNARLAKQGAAADAANIRRLGRLIVGAQIASAGASGAVVNEGTPLIVANDASAEVELEALLAIHGGEVAAFEGLANAALLANELQGEASITRFVGEQSRIAEERRAEIGLADARFNRDLAVSNAKAARRNALPSLLTDLGTLALGSFQLPSAGVGTRIPFPFSRRSKRLVGRIDERTGVT